MKVGQGRNDTLKSRGHFDLIFTSLVVNCKDYAVRALLKRATLRRVSDDRCM